MLRIIEANETEELSELRTVLQKTQLCDAVATLKQFLTLRDGTMNNVEVKQETTPVETTVFLDDNLVRVTLKATIDKSKDILRLRSMWDIALQRGTQKALEGKDKNAREVYSCKVVKVRIANKPDYSVLYLVHSDVFDFSLVVPFSDIGTTVFFSETEALKSRKEWESSMLT